MKKVKYFIFGILSILLISPVFADDVNLDLAFDDVITFESLKFNNSITYLLGGVGRNGVRYSYVNPCYLDSNFVCQSNIGYFKSTSSQSGSVFDNTNFVFSVVDDNYSVSSLSQNYYGYFGIGWLNGKLIKNSFSVYYQAIDSSRYDSNSGNKILNFGGQFSDQVNQTNPRNSYIRALYDYSSNSGLWFARGSYPVNYLPGLPTSLQMFNGSQFVYTDKGQAVIGSRYLDKVVSSVGNGFSFLSSLANYSSDSILYSDIQFYSVLPYWDSSWGNSTTFSIPSNKYLGGVYIFKNNSFGRDSQFEDIGVISKCTIDLCPGFSMEEYLSSLVVSNYLCDFSSSFDIGNNCILVGGGILYKVLGSITGLNNPVVYDNLPSFLKYNSTNPGVSFSFSTNPYSLKVRYYNNYWCRPNYCSDIFTDTFNIIYTGGYSISNSPNILGFESIPEITPPDSGGGGSNSSGNIDLNSGSAVDVLDILCNSSVIKPVWCNRINEVAPGVDGFWWLDLSGNLVYSLVGYDQNNGGYWYDLQSDGSGGYQFVCDIETDYFCPLTGSIGSFDIISPSDPQGIGFSGFILSQDYYDNFFTKTGYFAKCPYPYTDFNIGLHNKVLNKFYDTLGFDIFLPVNCGVAAFTAGKTFRFLSDVSLGLSPLMGEIHSPSDPRVYLYRFLDFLLSFALFMFLLKLYHLLN